MICVLGCFCGSVKCGNGVLRGGPGPGLAIFSGDSLEPYQAFLWDYVFKSSRLPKQIQVFALGLLRCFTVLGTRIFCGVGVVWCISRIF